MDTYSNLSRLHGSLFRNADRLRGVEREVFFDLEFLTEHVFGACSYCLKGKTPTDVGDRLLWMGKYFPTLQELYVETRFEWSARERYIVFVILMHDWVTLKLKKGEAEIRKIPRDIESYELSKLGIVSYLIWDVGTREFPTISAEFCLLFEQCQDVVLRGLAGDMVPGEFANARDEFEKLQPLFDMLWGDDVPSMALRSYLAGIGFCLSWLESHVSGQLEQ